MKHSRHALRYVDLHPEPVEHEHHPALVWLGAAFAFLVLWFFLVVLFSI